MFFSTRIANCDFDIRFVVRDYQNSVSIEKSLPIPQNFLTNIISNTCEKNRLKIRRYARHILCEKGLYLVEEGFWYLKQCGFDNYIYNPDILKNWTCNKQFEEWVSKARHVQSSIQLVWNGKLKNKFKN